MPLKGNGALRKERQTRTSTSSRTSPDQSENEEIVDIIAFQASLDESVGVVRSLVDSWIPKDLDPSWNTTSAGPSSSFASTSTAAKARPPRLGLGASASAIHQQIAEETKLRRLLNGNGRPKCFKETDHEEDSNVQPGELKSAKIQKTTPHDSHSGGDYDDDEEDSRSRSIKKRKVDASADHQARSRPTMSAISHGKTVSSHTTPQKLKIFTEQPLFNPKTPESLHSPVAKHTRGSAAHSNVNPFETVSKDTAQKEIAPSSFYATKEIAPGLLSKNERKKLRDKEKLEAEMGWKDEAEMGWKNEEASNEKDAIPPGKNVGMKKKKRRKKKSKPQQDGEKPLLDLETAQN